MDKQFKKKCIIILGMHRSGTSAFTGYLNSQGVNLGKDLLNSHESNKKGHFENLEVVLFNERILRNFDSEWYDNFIFDEQMLLDICSNESYIREAEDIIKNQFTNNNNLIAIKDPMICILFNFWKKVLKNLEYEILVDILYRDPLEVAFSLKKRDNIDISYGLSLWVKYMHYAEIQSRNENRVIIDYETFLSFPNDTLKKTNFIQKLDIELIVNSDFLDKKLKNNSTNLNSYEELPSYVYELSKILKLKTENDSQILDREELDSLYNEYMKNVKFFLTNSTKYYILKDYKRKLRFKSYRYRLKSFFRRIRGK